MGKFAAIMQRILSLFRSLVGKRESNGSSSAPGADVAQGHDDEPGDSAVYGVPLGDVADPESGVPPFVVSAIAFLEAEALDTEGIFRVSPSLRDVKELRARLDKGETNIFTKTTSEHSVASLLKMFFRDLPEPLLTYERYTPIVKMAAQRDLPASDLMERMRPMINSLPRENAATLYALVGLLSRVKDHKETNLMTTSNLSVVFGPTVLRPLADDEQKMTLRQMVDMPHIYRAMTALIEHLSDQPYTGMSPVSSPRQAQPDPEPEGERSSLSAALGR